MKSCVTNPNTGKPFTKHKYDQFVEVTSYSGSFATGMRPASYILTLTCERCGFKPKAVKY